MITERGPLHPQWILDVVHKRDVGNYTYREIAQQVGTTTTNVYKQYRAWHEWAWKQEEMKHLHRFKPDRPPRPGR